MKDAYYEAPKDTRGKLFAEIQKEYASRYHFHRAFEIAYVFEGEAKYRVEEEDFFAEKDQIIFAHCYYRHRSYDVTKHRKYVIAVPEQLAHDITPLLSESTLPHLLPDKEFNQTLLPYFKALSETTETTSEIVVKGYVSLIFGLLLSHYKSITVAAQSKNISIIVKILGYIDQHVEEPLSLGKIAEHFGYNTSYFSRLWSSSVGIPLHQYVNFLRLDRFAQLMKERKDESITDLVFKAGFPSLSTFYRAKADRKNGE